MLFSDPLGVIHTNGSVKFRPTQLGVSSSDPHDLACQVQAATPILVSPWMQLSTNPNGLLSFVVGWQHTCASIPGGKVVGSSTWTLLARSLPTLSTSGMASPSVPELRCPETACIFGLLKTPLQECHRLTADLWENLTEKVSLWSSHRVWSVRILEAHFHLRV